MDMGVAVAMAVHLSRLETRLKWGTFFSSEQRRGGLLGG